jgi:hypothetical protein
MVFVYIPPNPSSSRFQKKIGTSTVSVFFFILSVLFLLPGILLLSIGYGLKERSIRESRLVPNPSGYSYTNVNAMNITTSVASGCLVVQSYLNCSRVTYRRGLVKMFCYAQVSYQMLNGTQTTRLTATDFTTISSYFNYNTNQNVSCFSDIHRPDLVSYFPYVYPTANLRKGMIIAGYVTLALGLTIAILFTLSLIWYYFEMKEEKEKKKAEETNKAKESDKIKELESNNETVEPEKA